MKYSILFSLLITASQLLFAWGKTGHQVIGSIAEQHLSANAKTEIAKILGDENLAQASTWMDDVMNDERYMNQDNWHYCKKDEDLPNNGAHQLEHFIEVLKDDNASSKDKVLALRGVCHIVGDLHQPLHCGYIKDAGGNDVKVKWHHPHQKSNLHKAWDSDMILMKNQSSEEYAAALAKDLTEANEKEWANEDYNVWIKESQEHLDQVYDYQGKSLDKTYYDKNIKLIDERLSMAAIRLAQLLNSIYA